MVSTSRVEPVIRDQESLLERVSGGGGGREGHDVPPLSVIRACAARLYEGASGRLPRIFYSPLPPHFAVIAYSAAHQTEIRAERPGMSRECPAVVLRWRYRNFAINRTACYIRFLQVARAVRPRLERRAEAAGRAMRS